MTTPAVQPTTEFSVFLPLTKVETQPDGTLMVHTVLNDETRDIEGEIVTFEAIEKASPSYMEWANVREQHDDHTAAGTMVSLTPDPVSRTHEAIIHVVGAEAIKKVAAGVYKGSSLGGWKRRILLSKNAMGEPVKRVTEIDWIETSLVDRPARPSAKLTLLKRSDGGDPPTLIEEVEMDPAAPLAKVADAPAAVQEPVTEPVAPVDPAANSYVGPDGKPLAKAAVTETPVVEPIVDPKTTTEEPTAEPPTTPDVPRGTPLAKSASDDVVSAHIVIESINRLIEAEAGEGDQVTQLQAALAAMQRFETAENAEVGTPEDVAEAEAEEPIPVIVVDALMAYAAKGGDLRKIGSILEERLAKAAPPAVDVDELLAKTTTMIDERFARGASRADLEAMKAEVLGALVPIQEGLAKVANSPVPGGPARYAIDTSRIDGGPSPSTEAEVLAKAALGATDPTVKEYLGRVAAAAAISAGRATG